MPKPMFSESGVHRPWTPHEIADYSLRRLRDDYKMTFRELTTNDSGGFKLKNEIVQGGKILPHANIDPREKEKANAMLRAAFGPTMDQWNVDVLQEAGEDKDVQKIMQALGIPKTPPERLVKMDRDVVARGSDVLSLLDATPEELDQKAKERQAETETKAAQESRPLTREEYDKKMAEALASIERRMEKADKRTKEYQALQKEKDDLLESISKTETLAASVPQVQRPKGLVTE